MKAKIAVVQMNSIADRQANLKKMEELTAEAAANGADLILFPEHADFMGGSMSDFAEPDDGELAAALSAMAAKYQIYLHCGSMPEKNPEGLPFNTSLFFDRTGKLIAEYRKIHLFEVDMSDGPSVKESSVIAAGDRVVTVDTDFGRVGFAICYDLRFPELFHAMADQGAQLIFMPADFTDPTGQAHWEVLLRARAIENTCYIAAADQIGQKQHYEAHGNSMIIDPWGRVLARAEKEETILYAEFNSEVVSMRRLQMPSLKNARKDLFGVSAEKQGKK